MLRRLLPNIRYGTGRYPEKIARRLRVVNIVAWCGAVSVAVFALVRIADPERWQFGAVTLLIAAAMAAVPLLHRFGSLAASVALTALVYGHIFRIVHSVGTSDGIYLSYLTAVGLSILLLGIEHVRIAALLSAAAAALMLVLHFNVPPNAGFLPQSVLDRNFAVNVVTNTALLFLIVLYATRQTARAEATAEREYERSETLLANILPPKIADRLKDRGAEVIADRYDNASILFADMAGFTARASDTAPEELVSFLNDVFTQLDALVERHGLEKIKTTGDAYMVVSGVPEPRPDHAEALADLAIDMREALAGLTDPKGRAVPMRIGIASGPVVAGVVGTRKFFYDVWGDAVNLAARMEQTGVPGRIQVAPETRAVLQERFILEPREPIDVPGKGSMQTWFIAERKPVLAAATG